MQPSSDKTFTFTDPIDGVYIIELYAGDYVMIEETFSDVLQEYDDYVRNINSSFDQKDIPTLKSAVHKIKPLFGFVGLTALQALCLRFENSCLDYSPAQLAEAYADLKDNLLAARSIIENEKGRLQQFNQQ